MAIVVWGLSARKGSTRSSPAITNATQPGLSNSVTAARSPPQILGSTWLSKSIEPAPARAVRSPAEVPQAMSGATSRISSSLLPSQLLRAMPTPARFRSHGDWMRIEPSSLLIFGGESRSKSSSRCLSGSDSGG